MQSIPVAVDKNQSDSGPVSVNPHLPLTVSVDGKFSPVNALADSQMLKCRPGVSNIVHNYDRCSVTVIQSYVSTFAMSEREQLQSNFWSVGFPHSLLPQFYLQVL